MKQEDKQLLIKDLCARLPYEVKVQYEGNVFDIDYISSMYEEIQLYCATNEDYTIDISDIKPYLFPLSSMTEEQKEEFIFLHSDKQKEAGYSNLEIIIEPCKLKIDWLNRNHFDYRGLIEKSLAIDATNLNIY